MDTVDAAHAEPVRKRNRVSQNGIDHTLTVDDTAAFAALLRAQGALGPARTAPGQAQFLAFFEAIDTFAYNAYTRITNPRLEGWVDQLYAPLIGTRTCYGISAAGMYVLYVYAQFTKACFRHGAPVHWPTDQTIIDYWHSRGGREPCPSFFGTHFLPSANPWNFFGTSGTGMWKPPAQPMAFLDAMSKDIDILNAALQAAGKCTSTVALFIDEGLGTCTEPECVVEFEQSRFDPAHWTDAGTFTANLARAPLWQEQRDDVTGMLRPEALDGDDYLFLLYLLVALSSGDARNRQLAQRIACADASSSEYPNDTFANLLVYLTLLNLADPAGDYAWTNTQLQAHVATLVGAVTGTDPASQALKAALTRHGKVLRSDTSYPMHDPYCPSVGFNRRVSDTLFALDEARATLK